MALREKDQKNLDALIAFLETAGMRASLRGSAAKAKEKTEETKYDDLDLNVWDAQEEGPGYRLGRRAIDNFLAELGIKNVRFSYSVMATWCEGRWQFDFHETEFDVLYTPHGPSFLGYAATETPEDVEKKSKK
jgi:hypothetical protein